MTNEELNKSLRIFAIVLLFIIGLNALAAGYAFMADPSGGVIGIPLDYLQYSPFENFLIPGLILFAANGVLAVIVAIMAILKWKYHAYALVAQGGILAGWIIIQIAMVHDFNLLHFVCLLSGVIFLLVGAKLKEA